MSSEKELFQFVSTKERNPTFLGRYIVITSGIRAARYCTWNPGWLLDDGSEVIEWLESLELQKEIKLMEQEKKIKLENEAQKQSKKDLYGKDYVCPQCGPDSNGGQIHAMTHHTIPPYTLEEAKKQVGK